MTFFKIKELTKLKNHNNSMQQKISQGANSKSNNTNKFNINEYVNLDNTNIDI